MRARFEAAFLVAIVMSMSGCIGKTACTGRAEIRAVPGHKRSLIALQRIAVSRTAASKASLVLTNLGIRPAPSADILLSHSRVTADPTANTVMIEVTADDPDTAQTTADVIAWVSMKLDKEARLKDAERTIATLKSELPTPRGVASHEVRERLAEAIAEKQHIQNERIPDVHPASLLPN